MKLDTLVEVPGVGLVSNHLFMPAVLKVFKLAPKLVVSTDAPPIPVCPRTQLPEVEHALVDAAAVSRPRRPRPRRKLLFPRRARVPRLAANARKPKRRAAKPKALLGQAGSAEARWLEGHWRKAEGRSK